jgi:hypothetical protein
MGTCGSRFALRNRIQDYHYLNRRSFVQIPGNLVVPAPPLMGKEKGVSNGQSVNLDRIEGQNAAQKNEGYPYECFRFDFMSKTMKQSNERNGVC